MDIINITDIADIVNKINLSNIKYPLNSIALSMPNTFSKVES